MTLVIVALIGGSIIYVQIQHDREVRQADEAAQVVAFELNVLRRKAIAEVTGAKVPQIAKVARRFSSDLPELPQVSGFAADHSTAYQDVAADREQLAQALDRLEQVAKRADHTLGYLSKAETLLNVSPTSLIPAASLPDGEQVRRLLVDKMTSLLQEFRAVKVPTGCENVARRVDEAVGHVIFESNRVAALLDRHQSGSFVYGEHYSAARTAIAEVRSQLVTGDLQEAVNALG